MNQALRSSRDKAQSVKHLRIRSRLLEQIRAGVFSTSEPLPGERSLAASLGVAVGTMRRAMLGLESDGYVQRIPGKGTFVNTSRDRHKQSRTNSITVILPSISEEPYPELVNGLQRVASEDDRQVAISISDGVPSKVVLDNAARALALASTLDEIKLIRDKAEAVRKYAQSAALGLDAQNDAAEVKLRAERKAGQLLGSFHLRGGDRKSNSHDASLTLDDLGISKDQSARWQLEARLPDDEFEQYLRTQRDVGGEIVAAEVRRLARKRSKRRGEERYVSPNGNGHAACADATRISPQSRLPRDGEPPKPDELLKELMDQRDLLDDILRPIYTETSTELRSGERRMLGHLLAEIRALLDLVSRCFGSPFSASSELQAKENS